ncbi:hypothetical protein ABW19_dt0205102 [Dactylella cylindrospora]|nr:hypothetical protein ABW19_dt0205102 [Dactylella cylindrospora]
MPLTPEVLWAQRSNDSVPEKNIIYLTINVPDVPPEKLTLNLTSNKLSFKGTNVKGSEYALDIEFFEEIDPAESRKHHSPRGVDCVIRKKTPKEEFWPRLTKEKVKLHWLKTDFDKWVDEDEQDGPAPEPEYDPAMMSQFGGGGEDGFGGIDFSKLGGGADLAGMGGMGGLEGMGGMGGGPGLEDDSDDEDMPDLEGDEKGDTMAVDSTSAKGKKPIEELD